MSERMARGARVMTTHPTTVDTRSSIVRNPGAHSAAMSAMSWTLHGDRTTARYHLNKLTDDQRDELMTAAAILVAITGGVSEEALVAEAALSPDGIGGLG